MSLRKFERCIPQCGDRVFIDPTAVVIGDVILGEDSSVWPMTVIRADIHSIRIGARSSIQDSSVVHVTHDGPFNPGGYATTIGDEVTVGHKVMLHGCEIRDRVLVGMGAIIMDGVVVESDVIIGAGTLVPPGRTLESGYLYVGSPARQARRLTARDLEFFSYTANKYVELKNRYLAQSSGA